MNEQQFQHEVMDELRQEQDAQDQRDKMLDERRKQDAKVILRKYGKPQAVNCGNGNGFAPSSKPDMN